MTLEMFIGIAIGLILGLGYYVYAKSKRSEDVLTDRLEQKLAEVFPVILQQANEQLITMANQKLGSEKNEIKTDLDNKKKAFETLVDSIHKELKDNDRTSQSLLQQIKDHQKITQDLSLTTEGLKKVLTNNQLRGQFGEQVAEDLLKMAGFVRGVDFEHNKAQGNSTSRPDFSIFLPDKTKINIDVKFPYANLQKSTETTDVAMKQQYMKEFAKDVKNRIAEISGRDYINPQDKTVDFVIFFVPNEMIFSYVYDQLNEVWADGMTKKVIMAGPFSFTAILRMVRQAYDNFRYQKNVQEIIGHIREFEKQFDMYNEEFDKIGNHITSLSQTYNRVETTRTRQLTKVVEKIKLEGGETTTTALPLLDPVVVKPVINSSDNDDTIH